MPEPDLPTLVRRLAAEAKQAARVLAQASTHSKNTVLERVSRALRGPPGGDVLEANERDLAIAQDLNLSASVADRLRLDALRLESIAASIDAVRVLPDPIGEITALRGLDSGIRAGRLTVPLGVIAIVYEGHPSLVAEAATLCIKSGNACVLRGGKEAFHSSAALGALFADALRAEGLPPSAVCLLPSTQREAALALLRLDDLIDVAIPRGGDTLSRFVAEHARMPVLRHDRGVCHIFIDESASYDKAERIVLDGKLALPSAANATETVLVARPAADVLPRLCAVLSERGIEIRGCDETRALFASSRLSAEPSYGREHFDLVLNVKVVDGFEAALAHIAEHGTRHTEVIVTERQGSAQRFLHEVDASAVMVNASPRFNDGAELGLGTEIGLSTNKLHVYGPMGLSALCAKKWIVIGDGQTRG
jgi:glutamate-5-semialdehyde dehydrogenase